MHVNDLLEESQDEDISLFTNIFQTKEILLKL